MKGGTPQMKNGVRFLVFLVIVIVIRTQAQEVPKVEVGVQYSAQDIPSSRVGCVGCKVYNNGVGAAASRVSSAELSCSPRFQLSPNDEENTGTRRESPSPCALAHSMES